MDEELSVTSVLCSPLFGNITLDAVRLRRHVSEARSGAVCFPRRLFISVTLCTIYSTSKTLHKDSLTHQI